MAILTIENEADFTMYVLHSENLVLVDFWAPWCEPCKMIRAEVKRAADRFSKQLSIVKVNVDDFSCLAETYEVMAVPTLLFFKKGKPLKRTIGYTSQGEIEEVITSILSDTEHIS